MICPLCFKEIEISATKCPHCAGIITQEVQENWKAEIDQVVLGYEQHQGLVHGLQKDAIQNGWGHRLHSKGKDWEFKFKLIKDKRIVLLTMTDVNGFGLTGRNLKTFEIPDELPEEERLSRFEHMYFSGGATQGAGLFGRGKLLFTAASKDNHIIYDSLTHDGVYRLNRRRLVGRRLENFALAYENENASRMLKELTYNILKPLEKSGTRVIIVNPRDEIIEAIENNSFMHWIENTWWQIITKSQGAKISIETSKGIQYAHIPKEYKGIPEKSEGKWKVKYIPNGKIEFNGKEYKIKKLCFVVNPNVIQPSERGIYMYRREMKVAPYDIKDIPFEINDYFYGYVEIETNSEMEKLYLDLKSEGPEHCSLTPNALNRKIKKYVQLEFEKFKTENGYEGSKIISTHEKTAKLLKESLDELHKRLGKLGIGVGNVVIKKDIKILLENIDMPHKSGIVNIGDKISNIRLKILNISNKTYNLHCLISVFDQEGKEIRKYVDKDFKLAGNSEEFINVDTIEIVKSLYPEKGKVDIYCSLRQSEDSKCIATKSIPIFIAECPTKHMSYIDIDIEDILFPRGIQNRRINTSEKVSNITYSITNNLSNNMSVRFKIRLLDEKNKNEIINLCEKDIAIDSLKSVLVQCDDIVITDKICEMLDRKKGEVVLRATVTALENIVELGVEKGDKLQKLDTKIWINMDPGKGIFEDSASSTDGLEGPKSKIQITSTGYIFILNTTHPAYLYITQEVRDESVEKVYIYEQMVRQTMRILMQTEKMDSWPEISGKRYKNIIQNEKSEKYEIVDSYMSTIDYLQGESLG